MSQDVKATARRIWEEVIPSGDVTALAEVMHADSVDHSARPGEPLGIEGARQTIRWLKSAFSDLRFEIHHVIGDGDMVAVHCTMTGRHTGDLMGIPPTNRPVAVPMVHIVRFRDGKVAENWEVRNDAVTMRQLGVASGPGGSKVPAPAAT